MLEIAKKPSETRTLLVCCCIKKVQIWDSLALPIVENLSIIAHRLRWSAEFGVLAHIVLQPVHGVVSA